eukprot:Lithocolla_globosa_v1_NODE_673_length_3464_cov_7.882664.p3 type:complete len:108 gc:universal NODE_673_length_3464_cov_7.882664:1435-1758(+)
MRTSTMGNTNVRFGADSPSEATGRAPTTDIQTRKTFIPIVSRYQASVSSLPFPGRNVVQQTLVVIAVGSNNKNVSFMAFLVPATLIVSTTPTAARILSMNVPNYLPL